MVLKHLHSESEASLITRRAKSMVSPAPVKSQSLHNFALPLWNWSKNHQGSTNAQTYLRSRKVTAADLTRHRSSPPRCPESARASPCKNSADSENRRSCEDGTKNGCTVSSSDVSVEKSEKKSAADGRSKILIRFRTKNKVDDAVEGEGRGEGEEAVEESEIKTWNLRPRRAVCKRAKTGAPPEIKNDSSPAASAVAATASSRPESLRCRNSSEAKVAEKKEKPMKFSIPLSKEEIEEDFFVMTGSKPPRRPKKRARIIRKQLDSVFPGLWLATITPDSYRVPETTAKG